MFKKKKLTFEVDYLDFAAILDAIAKYQADHHAAFGETILPDGDGDMRGRILAEICRGYDELIELEGGA